MSTDKRPQRACDICKRVDDHPRHRTVWGAGDTPVPVDQAFVERVIGDDALSAADRASIVADLNDTRDQLRHIDCCRQIGCPDGSCNEVAASGGGNLRGRKLLDHITAGAIDHTTENDQTGV